MFGGMAVNFPQTIDCGRHAGEQYVNTERTRGMYNLVLIDRECDDLNVW